MSAEVIALATAAPRKVRQAWSRATKAQREALLRFPDIYQTDSERSAEKSAAILGDIAMTPALALAIAMFQTMKEIDQWRAQAFLACLVNCPNKQSVIEALEWTHLLTAKPARQREIKEALIRLQDEGRL